MLIKEFFYVEVYIFFECEVNLLVLNINIFFFEEEFVD